MAWKFDLPNREEIEQTIEVLRFAGRGLYRSRLPQMAAALAYRTIFGIIPALVVGLVVLRSFATQDDIESILQRLLTYTGISQIAVDDAGRTTALEEEGRVEPDGPDGPEADGPGADEPGVGAGGPDEDRPAGRDGDSGREGVDPGVRSEDAAGGGEPPGQADSSGAASDRLDEWIAERVAVISDLKLKTVGIVGIAVLIYAAISMLVEVERAFNQIYRAPSGRSWTRRITQYWAVLTLGSIVLVASFSVGEWFRLWVSSLTLAEGTTASRVLLTIAGFMTTVAISMFLLVFLYRTMPSTYVKLRPAFAGALVAAVLWEAGKWGFTRYIGYSSNLERLYGQMALLPLFLLWIYVTWLIVLFGLQVAHGLQAFSTWREEYEEEQEGPAIVDPAAVIEVVAAVATAFARGRSLTPAEVGNATGLREGVAKRMLDALAAAGTLNRVRKADEDEPRYALARPADEIQAADLVAVGQRMVAEPAHERTRAFYDDLRARTRELVAGRTMAAIVGDRGAHDDEATNRDERAGPGDGRGGDGGR